MNNTLLTKKDLVYDQKLAIFICSKHPNPFLYENVKRLRELYKHPKIAIIDSDSNSFDEYTRVRQSFPEVDTHFLKNKNYEYGAWKLGYMLYPDYDIYMCIQDSLVIHAHVDLNIINSNNAYTFYHPYGFLDESEHISTACKLMENTGLKYEGLLYVPFIIAAHCSFIVTNSVLKHMLSILIHPITNKVEERLYERIFGLYFILHSIQTHPMNQYFTKVSGGR